MSRRPGGCCTACLCPIERHANDQAHARPCTLSCMPAPLPCSPTLFPEEYVLEFQKCLDSTEPVAFEVIRWADGSSTVVDRVRVLS